MARFTWSAVAALFGVIMPIGPLWAAEIKAIPAAEGRPALSLPADTDLATLKLPDAIKVGLRLTWHAGDSVLPGVRSKLMPAHGPGQWIDPKTGKKFNDEELRGTGGVGYHQANILAASAKFVAVDGRNYAIVDQQNNITTPAGVVAASGNALAIGIYWIHPTLLALISAEGAPPQPAGITLFRGPYALGGKQYNSVAITAEFPNGITRSVYDTETGLLLFSGSSTLDGPVPVVDPNGNVTPGKGNTIIHHMAFVGARQVETPWMADPPPDWVAKGARLSYAGTAAAITSAGPVAPLSVASTIELGDVADGVVAAHLTTAREVNRGLPPLQSQEDHFCGSALVAPLWISPATLAKLKPNQVIDEDRTTRFRITFAGINQGLATLAEAGPMQTTEYFYDARSGMMTGVRTTKQEHIGQTRTEVVLQTK